MTRQHATPSSNFVGALAAAALSLAVFRSKASNWQGHPGKEFDRSEAKRCAVNTRGGFGHWSAAEVTQPDDVLERGPSRRDAGLIGLRLQRTLRPRVSRRSESRKIARPCRR
jgi:hypothetical protein